MPSPIEYGDVQGLIRFGYRRLTEACFFLLTIEDAAAARHWLGSAPVTSATHSTPPPDTALQVGFTWSGLRSLGLSARIAGGFSAEFIEGMAGDESRSRRLGDVGANAPHGWRWGARGRTLDVLVAAYATAERFEEWKRTLTRNRWATAFREVACVETSPLSDREPFGFRDGISQPALDWDRARRPSGDRLEYGNRVALGEFLLGHPNEYGKYTERPLVSPMDDPLALLPPADDDPGWRDLGRNGTYLVLRDLEQDVTGFWAFIAARAGTGPAAQRTLAAAMVGRTIDGHPLVAVSPHPTAGLDRRDPALNEFTYDADPDGVRCPVGAHIRRANPRTADLPAGTTGPWSRLLRIAGFGRTGFRHDLVASARFHRILRRGRAYNSGRSVGAAAAGGPPDVSPGLRFICLNANLARQFEFVQSAWIMGTTFDGLTAEGDPLLGSGAPIAGRPAASTFSIPDRGGLARRIEGACPHS